MARKRSLAAASGYTILVVDDQEETLSAAKLVLEREGHRVLLAESGTRALELLHANDVHLMLVDYFMPRMTGEDLVRAVRTTDPFVQIVLQTGYAGEKPPREMLRDLEIQGYHDKTDGPEKLLLWVDVALKAHEQLRQIREVERMKSQLLANLSHEFRTPLHVILGYAQMLEDEHPVPPPGSGTLDRIRRNARTLLQLVEDFLQLSDLDAGAVTSTSEEIDAATLHDHFAKGAALLVQDKPITFEWGVEGALPSVTGDPAKLGVIVMNLLSNAVKFTETGAITVTASATPTHLVLAIRDTGIGIPLESHALIFEPFGQVDPTDTRRHAGAGLGLPIARKLARLMGGDVTVSSNVGEGATFFLHLPFAAPAATVDDAAGSGGPEDAVAGP